MRAPEPSDELWNEATAAGAPAAAGSGATDSHLATRTEADDEALIEAYRTGDSKSFELLFKRYKTPLYNFILRFVGDRELAADLVHDLFVKMLHHAANFEGRAKFSTWMYTLARNLCVDALRKRSHRNHLSFDGAPASDRDSSPPLRERVAAVGPAVDRETIGRQLQAALTAAIERLPAEQREVFLLREVADLPFKEIAGIVSVPENTVKSRMRYALERLQKDLAEYEDYVYAVK